MSRSRTPSTATPAASGRAPELDAASVAALAETLEAAAVAPSIDAAADTALPHDIDGLGELVGALESLKHTAAAVQARAAVALDAAVRRSEAAAGVPAKRQGAATPSLLARARRESPHQARRLLAAARAWTAEMPHTWSALCAGELSEYRATILVTETAALSLEHRAEVDRQVAGDRMRLETLGNRELTAETRRAAYRLDPRGFVQRSSQAAEQRRVTVRPAPDTMTFVTGLLPVAQGVAVHAALAAGADAARASGDDRSRGQLMADLLVERVTGQSSAPAVPVTVNVTIADTALLAGGTEPALVGAESRGGCVPVPVPAEVARLLLGDSLSAGAKTWVRRLYLDPSGDLVALSSRRRFFADGLADYLRLRDQGTCRVPWCDAPARQGDHVVSVVDGGPTTGANGQAMCEACNLAKESALWPGPGGRPPGVLDVEHVWTGPPPLPVPGSRDPRPPGEASEAGRAA